jgi:hypothetical protein
MMDIEKNPLVELETVRAIQKKLIRNNQIWREVRTKEWKQRKTMISEERNTKMIEDMRQNEIETVKRILKEARADQLQREELWIQEVRGLVMVDEREG